MIIPPTTEQLRAMSSAPCPYWINHAGPSLKQEGCGTPAGLPALEFNPDQDMAQRIREQMRAQGLRIPLTEAEEFAAAERRMRGGV